MQAISIRRVNPTDFDGRPKRQEEPEFAQVWRLSVMTKRTLLSAAVWLNGPYFGQGSTGQALGTLALNGVLTSLGYPAGRKTGEALRHLIEDRPFGRVVLVG